ncbi:hypothetical protein ACOMHN_036056 [Nucella lapillus]
MDDDSSTKFIGSLTKFLQSLCNGYVEFQRGVELVGHIYLNIDTGEKVDYILHERVSKNDENSVTFVSNSFHAQPTDKKAGGEKDTMLKPVSRNSEDSSDDDNDIIMIVDQADIPGSTNSGTVPSRSGQHTMGVPSRGSASHQGSFRSMSSPQRNRQPQGGPSAPATSQDVHQENINIGNVKLEQISTDELLSLASQVGEGGSSQSSAMAGGHGGASRIKRSSSLGDTSGQPVWVKQEVPDDLSGGPDTGWSHGRDGQSDTSNSGSDLYPVMMHQNPSAYSSNPVFPGFTSISGHSSSSGSRHHSQSLPGMSGASNPYANPMPGTSYGLAGMDPAVLWRWGTSKGDPGTRLTYWQKVIQDPVKHERYKAALRERMRRLRAMRNKAKLNAFKTQTLWGEGKKERDPLP